MWEEQLVDPPIDYITSVNDTISKIDWLNQTYEWFKLKRKTIFMPQ